jgi:radical SAM protein with 4Fe4S-binding SPASM domain
MSAKEQDKKNKEINSFIESLKTTDTFEHPFIEKDNINPDAVKNLTIKKIKNYKLAMKEKSLKKTKLESRPYRIVIDPVNACNLGCPLCPTGLKKSERKKSIMDFNFFKKIIDEVQEYCIEAHLYNWGEPTLYKQLINMIKYCSDKNIWTRISTNFSLKYKEGYIKNLIHSGLSLLHIDIDGIGQEVYSKYRIRGDYDLVIKNLKETVKIKKESKLKYPLIEIAMLAMRQNEHQHKEFLNFREEFGVDIVKIDKIQHNPNMDEGWLPKNKKLIYKSYEGGEASSNSSSDTKIVQCHWPWSGIVVNPDGGINPCCIIDDPKSDFHNLNGKKISEIWNSKEYISSRSEFSDKSEIHKNTICNVCKNQTHSKRLSRVSKTFAIKL